MCTPRPSSTARIQLPLLGGQSVLRLSQYLGIRRAVRLLRRGLGFGTGYYYGRDWFANRPYEHRWWGPGGYVGYRDLRAIHDRGAVDIHDNRTNAVINHINIYNRTENVRRNFAAPVNRAEAINAAHEHTPGEHPEPAHAAYAHEDNNVYVGHDGAV